MSEHIDVIYKNLLQDILDNGEWIRNGRTTEAYCSVFGRQYRVSLREGFPAITTKKLFFRGVAVEMIWFLSGDTNVKYLQDNNVHIWDEWATKEQCARFGREEGDLGPVYSQCWRRWESSSDSVVLANQRQPEDAGDFQYKQEMLIPSTETKHELIGKVLTTKMGQSFIVLDKVSEVGSKNSVFKIQFLDTGFVRTASKPELKQLTLKDPYSKSVCGVGCLGEPREPFPEHTYTLWRNMLARCYDPNHPSFKHYGGNGVTVSKNWKCFANFLRDLPQVPYYEAWKANPNAFALDKDYYGSNQYSRSTCVFLDREYNKAMAKLPQAFEYNGIPYLSMTECADKNNLDGRRISEVLAGQRVLKGYESLRWLTPPSGKLYRKERVIDQIQRVVDRIKTNPSCRRLIVSGWDPANCDKVALPCCHTLFQFRVSHGGTRLNCQLYQRSADAFLGVPFNIASYALLTHLVAQVTGLEVGEFVHTFGDLHIYENHVEQVKLQLSREPLPLPKLWLNPEVKTIDEFKPEDIKLVGYQSHPAIKGDVAV